jgi:hypothetical protein
MVQRLVVSMVLSYLGLVSPAVAGAAALYESQQSSLIYAHDREDEGAKGALHRFRLRTEEGVLSIVTFQSEAEYRVTSELVGSAEQATITITKPSGAAEAEIELDWPGLRTGARFEAYGDAGRFEWVHGWTPECDRLVRGRLATVARDVLAQVESDLALASSPPEHLEVLYGALHVAVYIPAQVAGCEWINAPQAGGCYYDHIGYADCLACCDGQGGVSHMACTGIFLKFCRSPLCVLGGKYACGSAISFGKNLCRNHNCTGKPGDPACDHDASCEGSCIHFCGPGWSSACGSCEGEDATHQACCK